MTRMILTGADCGVTAVPNGFLDRYMPQANGEYVKIYLLLWRYFCNGQEISVAQLADLVDHTEKDVLRGIHYWVKIGLMQVSTNEKKELTGIRFLPIPVETELAATMEEPVAAPAKKEITAKAKTEAAPTLSSAKKKALAADEEFGQLVYIVGKYLDRPMKQTDSNVLGYLYGELGMRADLLEHLVECCVDAGHKSMHYIEKIALNWHEKGIRTVDDAREQAKICHKQYYQVLKAFGLYDRNPVPEEMKVMDQWFYEYGFTTEIVVEACNRTMSQLHKPNFEYAGGILADWKKKGVRSHSDIVALDEAFAKDREAKKGQRKETAKPNRFHNFEQVGYDYDAIVKELNG